ncbi:hypothetical protein ACFXK0_10995 [Nocardia sp. NPDC059177]|uniref:hypothetical protein n=1 Tax=Nocardia sp. NPDC059177 TaxID=3346759 RepID=UPI003687A993
MYTFQTPQPIAVTVEVLSADVTVVATDRTDTVVAIRPADTANKADVRAAEQTTVELTGDTLTVTTPKSWRTHTPFGGNPSIEVTIEVPTGSAFTGTAAVGRVVGEGELGECDLTVSLGDIVLDRPQGSVNAKTAKGDIRIGEATRGRLHLETSMGDLAVGIHPGSTVRLDTATSLGTVQNALAPADPSGDTVTVHARTSLGNIVIGHTAAA